MSVIIKGMEIPETCWDCFVDNTLAQNIAYFEANCPFTERVVNFSEFNAKSGRHPECPLVHVPTPHGRLIDAEALFAKGFERPARRMAAAYKASEDFEAAETAEAMLMAEYHIINAAPTIIEAEEE